MPWLGLISKPKPKLPEARGTLHLGLENQIFTPGKPDELGFITSAERALTQLPKKFAQAQALTADQWRSGMRAGGASNEAFTWQLEPALRSLAETGITGKITRDQLQEAMARVRGSLRNDVETKPPMDYSPYIAPGKSDGYAEHVLSLPESQGKGYVSHNWNSANPVGHVRWTNRYSAANERVRHVEELQSDLHQEGAQQGYRGEGPQGEARAAAEAAYGAAIARYKEWRGLQPKSQRDSLPISTLEAHRADAIGDETGRELFRTAADLRRKIEKDFRAPRAPMESWEEPFIRYALKQAADDGVELVTFPTHKTLHRALQNEGTKKFYDERLPNHLKKVAKSLGLEVEMVATDIPRGTFKAEQLSGPDGVWVVVGQFPSRPGEWATIWPGEYASKKAAAAAAREMQIEPIMAPAIRLTPEAKAKLKEGITQYAAPFTVGAVGLSLLFPEGADASVFPRLGKAVAAPEIKVPKSSLDMSEPARMQRARERGFDTDTPYYRVSAYDESPQNSRLRAVYYTTDPEYANTFPAGKDDDAIIEGLRGTKVFIRHDELADFQKPGVLARVLAHLSDQDAIEHLQRRVSQMPERETGQLTFTALMDPKIREAIERAGFSGVRLDDHGVPSVAIFDMREVRLTHAAFDPSQSGSGKLLAGVGVGAVVAASSMSNGEAEAQIGGAAKAMTGNPPAEDERPLPPSIARGQWMQPDETPVRATEELQAEVRAQREADERAMAAPDFWSGTIPAAFRRENVIGSWLSDVRINDTAGRAAIARGESQAFNPFEGQYLDGFEEDAERFADTLTEREADSLKLQITREREDMRLLALSGFPGFAAQVAAGTIDPTAIIPSGVTFKAGDSLLTFIAKGAWMGTQQAVISESLLQSTQELRTVEESALATAGGTLFGGIMGAGFKAFMRETPGVVPKFTEEMRIKGDDDPMDVARFADDAAMREVFQREGPLQSGSAAATPDHTSLEGEAVADVFGLDKASGAMGLNPLVRLANSNSAVAREVANNLMESGLFLKRNAQGRASPLAVETAMNMYRGREAKAVTAGRKAYKAHRKAGGSMSRSEFSDAVGQAMRRGDAHDDPHVTQAAQAYRVAVEQTKQDAISMKLLPEDVSAETADSYFHRMWNRKVLTSRPEAFQNMASEYLVNAFEGMKRRAMDLEIDLARFKAETDETKAARVEAGKARTKAANEVKIREERLEAAQRLLAGSEKRAKAAGAEWRKIKDGLTARPKPDADGPLQGRQEWDGFDEDTVAQLQKLEKDQEAFSRAGERARNRIAQLEEELAWHRPLAEKADADFTAAKRVHDETKGEAKLSADDQKLVEQVRELIELERIEGDLQGVAKTAAQNVYEKLVGYDQRTLPPRITIMDRGPLAERTFHIPDLFESRRPGLEARVEEFLVDDVEQVTARYMRVMSADIEMTRTFGDPAMTKAFRDINNDYRKLLAGAEEEIRDAAEEAAETSGKPVDVDKLEKKIEAAKRDIEQRRKKDLKDIAGVRDVLRGNYGSPAKYDDLFVRGGAFIRNWNYMTLLGGMTVSAFPDMANKVLSNGMLGITRDLVGPLVTDLKGIKIAAREAREYGVAIEGALNARIASMADIGDVYGKGTAFERAVAAIGNNFSGWTGMRLWNDVMKTADYVMAQNRAIRILEATGSGNQGPKGRASGRDINWLAWAGVGVNDSMAERIRVQLRMHGDLDRGMRLGNSHLWDDREAARAFQGVMAKEAATVTVTPGAGDKLLAMHGELGKTIGQFKTFAFAAHQRVTLRALQQARRGDMAVGSYMTTAIALGMLVYYLKMGDSLREASQDPATVVREGVDRSGMLPLLFEVLNTAEKVTGQTFIGDRPASRYQSRGAFASLLGPTVGRGEDVAALIRGLADGNLKDTDIHAVRKLLPFNNLIFARRLFDMLEMQVVDATGAEETSFSDGRRKALAN